MVLLLKDCLLPTATGCDNAAIQPQEEIGAIRKPEARLKKESKKGIICKYASFCCGIAYFLMIAEAIFRIFGWELAEHGGGLRFVIKSFAVDADCCRSLSDLISGSLGG
ncbi:hypothetical protein ACO34A_23565 (plasmid) [Rhizobium sp. ACO-34A]|nr:hypothetical protein ACO34A_23565 [Rhizobium sp. ACO-34A]